MIEFFIPMKKIPTVTHQEKKVTIKMGNPFFYDPPELDAARLKFMSLLVSHAPIEPLDGPIRLITKWMFGKRGCEKAVWKTTKPDTDNMIKLFKDCMTKVGYWHDDAQVCCEVTEKFWNPVVGIYVKVERL